MVSKRTLGIVVALGMGVVLACEAGPTAAAKAYADDPKNQGG